MNAIMDSIEYRNSIFALLEGIERAYAGTGPISFDDDEPVFKDNSYGNTYVVHTPSKLTWTASSYADSKSKADQIAPFKIPESVYDISFLYKLTPEGSTETMDKIRADVSDVCNLTYDDYIGRTGKNITSTQFLDLKKNKLTTLKKQYCVAEYTNLPPGEKNTIMALAIGAGKIAVDNKVNAGNNDIDALRRVFVNNVYKTIYTGVVSARGDEIGKLVNSIRKQKRKENGDSKLGQMEFLPTMYPMDNPDIKEGLAKVKEAEKRGYKEGQEYARSIGLTKYADTNKYGKIYANRARREAIKNAPEQVKQHFANYNRIWSANKSRYISYGFGKLPENEQEKIRQTARDTAAELVSKNPNINRNYEYNKAMRRLTIDALKSHKMWPPPMMRLQGSDTDAIIPLRESIEALLDSIFMESYCPDVNDALFEAYDSLLDLNYLD